MSDQFSELKSRLVVGRKRDGRCVYDEIAKSELIALCQRPGVSVARVARECGVNANQVCRWLRERGHVRRPRQATSRAVSTPTAFVAVPVVSAC